MKKFLYIVLGIIGAIVVLANLGSLIGLAFSALLVIGGLHYFLQSGSTLGKLFWATVGIVGLLTAISNIPAFIGIAALALVWYAIRKCSDSPVARTSTDPFENFEREWKSITRN
ncbi:ABC transporter permease [Chryseomicrobium sp. FSL W7-1435]|uniref:lmo0954 family membrane protein n=1 Tax=Chryseomicrobium sp. FSL W7-1435 TaxID=2921704 RepID=UPI00315A07CF